AREDFVAFLEAGGDNDAVLDLGTELDIDWLELAALADAPDAGLVLAPVDRACRNADDVAFAEVGRNIDQRAEAKVRTVERDAHAVHARGAVNDRLDQPQRAGDRGLAAGNAR